MASSCPRTPATSSASLHLSQSLTGLRLHETRPARPQAVLCDVHTCGNLRSKRDVPLGNTRREKGIRSSPHWQQSQLAFMTLLPSAGGHVAKVHLAAHSIHASKQAARRRLGHEIASAMGAVMPSAPTPWDERRGVEEGSSSSQDRAIRIHCVYTRLISPSLHLVDVWWLVSVGGDRVHGQNRTFRRLYTLLDKVCSVGLCEAKYSTVTYMYPGWLVGWREQQPTCKVEKIQTTVAHVHVVSGWAGLDLYGCETNRAKPARHRDENGPFCLQVSVNNQNFKSAHLPHSVTTKQLCWRTWISISPAW